ncbi:MAG: hypothetical protein Q7R50_04725 [Dehalococcoidales bacterium]|nr:hypothetical protein [Dehalococcoidales bacterium]
MTTNNIAWIVALGGWVIALLQYYFGYRERARQREEDLLVNTLSYFEGKSQKRSIGISLVEGIWTRKMERMDVLVPVLLNQTIYLLLSSSSVDAAHEERNLVRLLYLLKRCIPHTSNPNEYYPEILNALIRKDPEENEKGIPLSRPTLRYWFADFGGSEEHYDAEHPNQPVVE